MQSIISKLNTLKSIEPEENWVVETRKRVLSEAPDFSFSQKGVNSWKITEIRSEQKSGATDKFFSRTRTEEAVPRLYATLFSKRLAILAFSLVFLVSGGILTVEASKSSLPGDALYIVKIATEDVTLAIASKEKKPEIEIEQAGKRLEELSEISKKPSDSDQKKKTEQLLASFEKKVNNAQSSLTKIENNGVKAKIAKVINVQTEKYTEVLVETSENLPNVVKTEVSEKFASAVDSNEKVNFDSLTTRVELMTDEDEEEITAMVKEKVEEKESVEENEKEIMPEEGDESGISETDLDLAGEEAEKEKEMEMADDSDAGAEESEETEITMEDTKKELLEILGDLNNPDGAEGDVMEDEDCVCEIDIECGCADAGDEGEIEGDEGDLKEDDN